jgi:hypothetical protein
MALGDVEKGKCNRSGSRQPMHELEELYEAIQDDSISIIQVSGMVGQDSRVMYQWESVHLLALDTKGNELPCPTFLRTVKSRVTSPENVDRYPLKS